MNKKCKKERKKERTLIKKTRNEKERTPKQNE